MGRNSSIEILVDRLSRYSGLRMQQSKDSIVILAPREEGFDIRIAVQKNGLSVTFDAWQRAVDDVDTAWNLIAVGLSNGSRLRLEPAKDGRPMCWLEIVLPDGSWRTLPEAGRSPDRLNSAVYYRQNDYVRASYKDHRAFMRTSPAYQLPLTS